MRKRSTILVASFLILLMGLWANSYAQKPKQTRTKAVGAGKTEANHKTRQAVSSKKDASVKQVTGSRKQSGQTIQKAASAGAKPAPVVGRPVNFGVTPRLRDIKLKRATTVTEDRMGGKERPIREVLNSELLREKQTLGLVKSVDSVVQRAVPEPNMPLPDVSFEGANNRDNFAVFGGRVLPPDTNGDVGPNHYVQTVNLVVNIYDKSGNLLVGPFAMSDLFASIGGTCAVSDDGDPIVLYDHLADRWLISQFAVVGPPYHQCIAISQNGDPTGAYYAYDFVMPNTKFNDYPHFGVWPDGYYMMDHQFGSSYDGGGAFAFDRAKLLAGDPAASFIYFDLQFVDPAIGGHLPSDLDGPPPPAGTPNYFAMFRADEFGDPFDGIEVFEFAADFTTPTNSTWTSLGTIPIASFDPISRSGRTDVDQPPPATTAHRADAIADRLMHRLQYRNFGTYETLVGSHTVDVSGDPSEAVFQAGVRYFELRRALPAGSWTVNEVASFAPTTDHRWMGSAAMDGNGNIAVGYSISSLTVFPGINIAGRLASDPPNGLWQGESVFMTGSGSQTSTSSRWGDYSAMSVDPVDDCRFWYTQEYYPATNPLCPNINSTACWHTRIVSFEFPGCVAATQGAIDGYVYDSGSNPVAGARVILEDANNDLWEVATDANGYYSRLLAPGVYTAFARATNYIDSSSTNVNVTAGGTTSTDFHLGAGSAVLAVEQADADDSNGNGDGRIDFNECIDLTVALRNDGSAEATGISATLVSNTPGVTVGTDPLDFDDIPAGDVEFSDGTYSVSIGGGLSCGDAVDLTLNVTTDDGGYSLPVSFNLSTPPGIDGPIALADAGTLDLPIVVSGLSSITDINVSLHLTHSWAGDMDISLIHPDGTTTVELSSDNGGSGDNYGTSCGARTTFDDEAGTSIVGQAAPFAGSFIPEQALSAFDGLDPNGTWTLRLTDDFAVDTGTFLCATLEINGDPGCADGGGVCGDAAPNLVAGDPAVSGGNGDDDVDLNDCLDVVIPITNIGTADATNVVATITTTNPNITILNGTALYGDISAGATEDNVTPFQVATGATCPDATEFTMTIQADEGPQSTTANLLSTGTFTSEPQVVVTDNGGPVFGEVPVSGMAGTVTNIKATIRVSHTYASDLDLFLEAPDGTFALLTTFPNGGNGDGFGIDCPADGNDTTFDDAAVTPISAGSAPFSGSFIPEDPMSTFNGVDPNGTWSIVGFDTWPGDVGIIHCVKLEIETTDCDDAGGTCTQAPVLSINDRTVTEGDSGTTNLVFTAHLSFPIGTDVTADVDTFDGTATTADNDYTGVSTGITILSGDQDAFITVPGITDTTYELDEDFEIELSNISGNATAGDAAGTGTILNDDPCPVITLAPATLPAGPINTAYSDTVTASGGIGPYTYAVTDGTLPNGLTLNAGTGEISGTPTMGGGFTFDITATDAGGCEGTATYTITITCPAITLSPTTLPDGEMDVAYPSTTLTPTGGTGPYTFAVTSGSLPAGLTLNTTTGEISGTPTAVEVANFTITVTDSLNCTGDDEYTVTIMEACLFCDEFDDSNMDWVVVKPNWTENGDELVGTSTGKAIVLVPASFSGCEHCSIEASMESSGGTLWMLGWYVDKFNTIELLLKTANDKIVLKQKVGGTTVDKQSAPITLDPNVAYKVKMLYDGSTIEVFIDDVSVMVYTPAGTVFTGTAGFQLKDTTGTFDYIHIEEHVM